MAGRILIVFDGTRGDTQPYLLAAKALMKADFDVMVTGPGGARRCRPNGAGVSSSFYSEPPERPEGVTA